MKKEPSVAQKKEDLIFYKILILFLICFVIEIAFLIMNRLYLYVGTFMTAHAIAYISQYVAAGLLILGVVLAALLWKKEKARYGILIATAGIVLFLVCQFMEYFYPFGAKYLCVIVPIVLLLGLVYYIYQREFLVSAVLETGMLIYLWIFRQIAGKANWAFILYGLTVAMAVLLIVCAILAWRFSKSYGRVKLFGKTYALIEKTAKYQPIYASCAIGILAIAAALLFGVMVAYYAMFVIGGYLLVLAVYYTTKLI